MLVMVVVLMLLCFMAAQVEETIWRSMVGEGGADDWNAGGNSGDAGELQLESFAGFADMDWGEGNELVRVGGQVGGEGQDDNAEGHGGQGGNGSGGWGGSGTGGQGGGERRSNGGGSSSFLRDMFLDGGDDGGGGDDGISGTENFRRAHILRALFRLLLEFLLYFWPYPT
jgi:hypothetical protein